MPTYYPPHVRQQGGGGRFQGSMDIRNSMPPSLAGDDFSSKPSLSDGDVYRHFWPSKAEETRNIKTNTLNASEARPGEVGFVLVYASGHPRWETDGIIFTKSDLHLLPGFKEKLAERRAEMKLQRDEQQKKQDEADQAMKTQSDDVIDAKDNGDTNGEKAKEEKPDGGDSETAVAALEEQMENHQIDAEKSAAIVNDEQSANGHAAAGTKPAADLGEKAEEIKTPDVSSPNESTSKDGTTAEMAAQAPAKEEQNTQGAQKTKDLAEETFVLRDIPPIDYAPGEHAPIAVFMTRGHQHFGFRFVGWFTIAKIAILLPRSQELDRLMKMKWENPASGGGRDFGGRGGRFGGRGRGRARGRGGAPVRSRESWESDMGREWAVLKLARMDASSSPPEPVIEKRVVRRNYKSEEDEAVERKENGKNDAEIGAEQENGQKQNGQNENGEEHKENGIKEKREEEKEHKEECEKEQHANQDPDKKDHNEDHDSKDRDNKDPSIKEPSKESSTEHSEEPGNEQHGKELGTEKVGNDHGDKNGTKEQEEHDEEHNKAGGSDEAIKQKSGDEKAHGGEVGNGEADNKNEA